MKAIVYTERSMVAGPYAEWDKSVTLLDTRPTKVK